ncbi:hypothetical protein [Mycolicibacterium sp. P1-5]|nr:hypothetical protein [Mycolicibacterium sp. P1-5]
MTIISTQAAKNQALETQWLTRVANRSKNDKRPDTSDGMSPRRLGGAA